MTLRHPKCATATEVVNDIKHRHNYSNFKPLSGVVENDVDIEVMLLRYRTFIA